jgi:hypothetical protein
MFFNCLPCCQKCSLPLLPDYIETEIVRVDSQYANFVFGKSPIDGPEIKLATGIAWTFPEGVFQLLPVSGSNTLEQKYEYENQQTGISLEVIFRTNINGDVTVLAAFGFSVLRQKTFYNSSSPPTLEELQSDSWASDNCLNEFHPSFGSTFGRTVRVRKCSFGTGSAERVSQFFGISDFCNSLSLATTRTVNSTQLIFQEAAKICPANKCTFPLDITMAVRPSLPHTDGLTLTLTNNLVSHRDSPFSWYVFSSEGLSSIPSFASILETGVCSARMQNLSLVYSGQKQDVFPPSGQDCVFPPYRFPVVDLGSCL